MTRPARLPLCLGGQALPAGRLDVEGMVHAEQRPLDQDLPAALLTLDELADLSVVVHRAVSFSALILQWLCVAIKAFIRAEKVSMGRLFGR